MERICFLKRIEISRIIFNVIRQELNMEDVAIQNNPYNSVSSKCIVLHKDDSRQILLVSTIYNNTLHFTIDVYKNNMRIYRSTMFGSAGIVNYTFTRKTKEEFEKDCIIEFWKAFNKMPKYMRRRADFYYVG